MWALLVEWVNSNPIIVAAVPSTIAAVLAYLRSVRLDKLAEVSGAASFQLTGLIAHNGDLQKDNQILRERIAVLEKLRANGPK